MFSVEANQPGDVNTQFVPGDQCWYGKRVQAMTCDYSAFHLLLWGHVSCSKVLWRVQVGGFIMFYQPTVDMDIPWEFALAALAS